MSSVIDRYIVGGDIYSIRQSGSVYSLWMNAVWQPTNSKSRVAARKKMRKLIGAVLDERAVAAMRYSAELQRLRGAFHCAGIEAYRVTEAEAYRVTEDEPCLTI